MPFQFDSILKLLIFFDVLNGIQCLADLKKKTNVIKSATPLRDKWQINIIYGIKSFNYGTVAFRYSYCSNCLHVGPLTDDG